MTRVAVDAGGADLGPAEVAAGAAIAAREGVQVVVFGDLEGLGEPPDGVRHVHAPASIAKAPDPARAVRQHRESSIVRTVRAVADGEADAFVAGGSTGPALAAGLFEVKRARGIHRPALAIALPIPGRGPVTLLDVGANAEVRPEHLVQFAFMGAALVQTLFGVERPRVGLLSNGTEATKGTTDVVAAHALLDERAGAAGVHFLGNVEGTDITSGEADVIVTDGFTGNITLKAAEGVSEVLLRAIRSAAESSPRSRAGGLLLRPALRGLRDEIDPERAGGAYLLGLRRLGIVPHGRFSREGIARAILLAARGVDGDLIGRTHAALDACGALRTPPSAVAPRVSAP